MHRKASAMSSALLIITKLDVQTNVIMAPSPIESQANPTLANDLLRTKVAQDPYPPSANMKKTLKYQSQYDGHDLPFVSMSSAEGFRLMTVCHFKQWNNFCCK